MSDFQNEMNRTVQGFVAQITELARRAALDTLESAFQGRAPKGNASTNVSASNRSARADAGPKKHQSRKVQICCIREVARALPAPVYR